MSKRFWLGYRTILLGWSFALMALIGIGGSGGLTNPWIVPLAVLLFAASVAWEWARRTKAAGPGTRSQARNHSTALAATGVIVGLPLSALALYALPSLFTAIGLPGAQEPAFGTVTSVIFALVFGWILAAAWKYNCAPEWIDG